jgi:hypothetical protein
VVRVSSCTRSVAERLAGQAYDIARFAIVVTCAGALAFAAYPLPF